jgi:[ribosomal protein S5]-alanine N-acetyltransferase
MSDKLTVRELQEYDIQHIVAYWLNSDTDHLVGMGVDLAKLPTREQMTQMLQSLLLGPVSEKPSYCTIWEVNGIPVGHCNVNQIVLGEQAFMHLHLWQSGNRQKGIGIELVKKSLTFFFENLQLKTLFCEPYALNPAPNKTLQKLGFTFVKEYVTIPGSLNFEQPVKRWELNYSNYKVIVGNQKAEITGVLKMGR